MGAASREEHASGVLTPKITQAQLRSKQMLNNEEIIIQADSFSFSIAWTALKTVHSSDIAKLMRKIEQVLAINHHFPCIVALGPVARNQLELARPVPKRLLKVIYVDEVKVTVECAFNSLSC